MPVFIEMGQDWVAETKAPREEKLPDPNDKDKVIRYVQVLLGNLPSRNERGRRLHLNPLDFPLEPKDSAQTDFWVTTVLGAMEKFTGETILIFSSMIPGRNGNFRVTLDQLIQKAGGNDSIPIRREYYGKPGTKFEGQMHLRRGTP